MFDLATMGYVETLFGHQAPILSIDALRGETAVSVGGRDKTVRYWKVPEESQLVFRGGGGSTWHDDLDGMDEDGGEDGAKKKAGKAIDEASEKFVEGSIECVAMIDETTFVSGGDSGCVVLLRSRDELALIRASPLQIHQLVVNTTKKARIHTGARPRDGSVASRGGGHQDGTETSVDYRAR